MLIVCTFSSAMFHEISVLILHMHKFLLQVFSRTRGLNIDLSLHLHPYFEYANSRGFAESVFAQARLRLQCSIMQLVPKSYVLAHFIFGPHESFHRALHSDEKKRIADSIQV